ncbi:MAG: replication-associated recombination protein A [Deltaproteobacteria bacterium]|nr:MAG: replication-associated recombination protein A [Deltaproteobacteria bacterium]
MLWRQRQGEIMERKTTPLATRMRPERIEDIVGQDHLLGPSRALRRSLETGNLFSVIFWGPPGSGKTTIAKLIAQYSNCPFESFSAVLSGVKELREVIDSAKRTYRYERKPTILFVDEIHRFNKAQQDAFLPHVESGLIILIGATTQNPSFEIIPPLLSRARVMTLKPLHYKDMVIILNRAIEDKKRGLGDLNLEVERDALQVIVNISYGDARTALNNLESASYFVQPDKDNKRVVTRAAVALALNKKPLMYDKDGEEHYNLISALHKSMRGSDTQASLYWLYRMLEAGEDPLFIGRRLIRFASEDVGLADPKALEIALTAYQAWERVGPPEARLSLAQAVVYLATAPKSNSLYVAERSVTREIEESGPLPVPLHLRNAPTRLMKEMGYGKGYIYPHDHPDGRIRQEYFPQEVKKKIFYRPSGRAFEKEIRKKMTEKKKLEDSDK